MTSSPELAGKLDQKGKNDANDTLKSTSKRIILIRHGRTYANEFLATPGTRWGDPGFYDDESLADAKLSPHGVRQALELRERLLSCGPESVLDLNDIDLIAVSPLTRTIQTLQLGFGVGVDVDDGSGDGGASSEAIVSGDVPIVALPLARERLFFCSDIGEPVSSLRKSYPWIDFKSEFYEGGSDDDDGDGDKPWWYVHPEGEEFCEWRPHGEGQRYFTKGEPEHAFNERMVALYDWLEKRSEKNIVVVAHWGVFQKITGKDYDNCQIDVVRFEDFRRNGYPSH